MLAVTMPTAMLCLCLALVGLDLSLGAKTLANPKLCTAETLVGGAQWPTRYYANDCIMPVTQNPARAGAVDINLVVMNPYQGAIGDVMTKVEPMIAAAAQEIEDSTILPGYRLNLYLADSACTTEDAIATTIRAFQTPPVKHGILGDSCSGCCMAINDAMQIFNVLQIAPICTSTVLSNHDRYPYFVRFSPSLRWNVESSIAILKLLSWRRVAVITENRAITIGQMDIFAQVVEAEAAAGTYPWVLLTQRKFYTPADAPGIIEQMLKYDARIIVTSLYEDEGAVMLCEAHNRGMFPPNYVWFVASGWWNANFLEIREGYVKTSVESYGGTACTVSEMTRAGFGLLAFDRGPMRDTEELHGRSGRKLRDIKNQYTTECGAFADGTGMCQMLYAGYFYDGLWEWAWLLDQYLVQLNNSISDLGTEQSRQWLYEKELHADFMGVTGRVRHFNDADPVTDPPSHGDRDGTILLRQLTHGDTLTTTAHWSQGSGFEWFADLVWSISDASKIIVCTSGTCDVASGFVPLDRIDVCPPGSVFHEARGCEPCIQGYASGAEGVGLHSLLHGQILQHDRTEQLRRLPCREFRERAWRHRVRAVHGRLLH